MVHLGVNIDHVATLRNARGGIEPDPVSAAELAVLGGADAITVHLREDRRHIIDEDVWVLRQRLRVPLNLEMSISPEIVAIAEEVCPAQVTLVPEKREEQTTESGLDVIRNLKEIDEVSERLRSKGVRVSLFVDPDPAQLQACLKTSSRCVEIHTGAYANCTTPHEAQKEIDRIAKAALWCKEKKVRFHAGHGLNYHNTQGILHMPGLGELNIGHSIVSRAVLVGLQQAVRDMRVIIDQVLSQEVIDQRARLLENSSHPDK